MSSVEYLREFVNERLSAAAEEILGVFTKTIVDYKEELERQRRLLDVFLKPEINLDRIDVTHFFDWHKEDVLADQQPCNREMISSLQQENPEPPHIKEEERELCTSQEGEQLVPKQETHNIMLTPTYEKDGDSEDQTLDVNPDKIVRAANKESAVDIPVTSSVVSELNSELQLPSRNSNEAENKGQKGGKHKDSKPTRDAEPKQNKQQHNNKRIRNIMYNPSMIETDRKTHTNKKSFKCDICGKDFKGKSAFQIHLRIHTGDKPYPCSNCDKRFSQISILKRHIRVHTGEKPYLCKICGKKFKGNGELTVHMRIHTGERPYSCKTCGKDFIQSNKLTEHVRRAHTGEKPYLCKICGKGYCVSSHLKRHMRSHSGK